MANVKMDAMKTNELWDVLKLPDEHAKLVASDVFHPRFQTRGRVYKMNKAWMQERKEKREGTNAGKTGIVWIDDAGNYERLPVKWSNYLDEDAWDDRLSTALIAARVPESVAQTLRAMVKANNMGSMSDLVRQLLSEAIAARQAKEEGGEGDA